MTRALAILAPGPLASVQDLGRPGFARLGIARGGAADRGACALANRLVGNPETAAVLEITAGGFVARAQGSLLAAVTGAAGTVRIAERIVSTHAPQAWPDAEMLRVDAPRAGLRSYLAIAGGVDTPVVLGSRSYSRLGGLGAPLEAGDVVPIGSPPAAFPVVDHAIVPEPERSAVTLAATLGPRADWFGAEALEVLLGSTYAVTPHLDRTGIRLAGPPVRRARDGELPSEGMVRGAVQIPAQGIPIIFGSDHPATGGYPVPLVLTPAAADLAAQLTPGMSVRLRLAPHAGLARRPDRMSAWPRTN